MLVTIENFAACSNSITLKNVLNAVFQNYQFKRCFVDDFNFVSFIDKN